MSSIEGRGNRTVAEKFTAKGKEVTHDPSFVDERGDDSRERLSRREVLSLLGMSSALPLTIASAMANAAPSPSREAGSTGEVDVYERLLGVRPVINAGGPITVMGGTVLSREVTDAMAEAARGYVDLEELYAAAGQYLANLTRAEAAMVTAGAASAMVFGAAACLARDDEEKAALLPNVTWPRREALIQRAHSTEYDRAYRNAGMEIVYVDTEEELLAAIGERTAMIAGLTNVEKMHLAGSIMPERLVAIGKRSGVPVFLDASFSLNQIPMVPLWRYIEMGADLVAVSGGKGLRGPQSTGYLAGRADLIEAARAQASPAAGLGRGMKVDKEEVIGLVVAMQQFLARDHEALYRRDRRRVEVMRDRLQGIPGLRFGYEEAFFGPGLVLMWAETDIPLTYDAFIARMREGERPIAVVMATGPNAYFAADVDGPGLFAGHLNDGEEQLVAERAREILLAARSVSAM